MPKKSASPSRHKPWRSKSPLYLRQTNRFRNLPLSPSPANTQPAPCDLFVNARWKAATGIGVLELLQTESGDIWVLRGWVPAGPRSDISPDVSSPPGQITVDGLVRPLPRGEELTDRGGLPGDQVTDVESAQLPMPGNADWYVQALNSEPRRFRHHRAGHSAR